MHARFNLDPENENWSEYYSIGLNIHDGHKSQIEYDLKRFENSQGVLQAKDIIENWFPAINSDVFLSHSHKDEKIIVGLAGWLHNKFGLKPFIDSAVWGYSDKLLKAIDDECDQYKTSGTYNYHRRNRSTSHVHMMLSTALMDMIDRCECIMFVNTANSFTPSDYLMSQGETESPWIYSEIAMTRILRQKSPNEHRMKAAYDSVNAALEHFKEAKELRVTYPLDMLHLTPLSLDDLGTWETEEPRKRYSKSLDTLYGMMSSTQTV